MKKVALASQRLRCILSRPCCIWVFLSVYLIFDDNGSTVRRRQFYRFWRSATNDQTPVPPEYFVIKPGMINPVDPTGPAHTW